MKKSEIDFDDLKWNNTEVINNEIRPYPLWIAEMDNMAPMFLIDKICHKIETTNLGYFVTGKDFAKSVQFWYSNLYDKKICTDSIIPIESVLVGISACVHCFTSVGDNILIFDPEFHQIKEIIVSSDRNCISNNLIFKNHKFYINWNNLEDIIKSKKIKMIIISNPHNPGGQCFTEKDNLRLEKLAVDNNVIIISDEIHSDLVYSKQNFNSFVKLDNSIVLNSVSKAFNMSGAKSAYLIACNSKLRNKINKWVKSHYLGHIGFLGTFAVKYGYSKEGLNYIHTLCHQLKEIENKIEKFCSAPAMNKKFDFVHCQASYLFFLQVLKKYPKDKLKEKILSLGYRVSSGSEFGNYCDDFIRFSFGISNTQLKKFFDCLSCLVDEEDE